MNNKVRARVTEKVNLQWFYSTKKILLLQVFLPRDNGPSEQAEQAGGKRVTEKGTGKE